MARKTTEAAMNARMKAAARTASSGARTSGASAKTSNGKKTTKPVTVELFETTMQSGLKREEIEKTAYNLFEIRGRDHGHDLEDWLEAERIVLRREKVRS